MKANKNISPIWENYKNWECYKNGMYENEHNKEKVKGCYEILTSNTLKEKMQKTANTYKVATKVNFTNQMFNPVSWLGQATCNLFINATAQETCQAWMSMTKEQQIEANNIAKEVITEWRCNFENLQR